MQITNDLEKRVVDISYKHNLCHLSSTLSSVNIINEIYATKKSDEVFVLSNGHSALALYCVIEKYLGIDAEMLLEKHGIHPHRDPDNDLWVSTGSLGMGITVACGYALADPNKNVYCLISDGESAEGSVWEALRFAHEQDLNNLKIYAVVNGQIAYDKIDVDYISQRYRAFSPKINIRYVDPIDWPWAEGILTHYYILKDEDYQQLCASYLEN